MSKEEIEEEFRKTRQRLNLNWTTESINANNPDAILEQQITAKMKAEMNREFERTRKLREG